MNFKCECGGFIVNGKDSHCLDCLINADDRLKHLRKND